MDVRAFDFALPPELIAQEPPAERGGARLLHLDRTTGAIVHTLVRELPSLLRAGDLLVVNNTRVFPARLLGRRVPSGGAVECLLVRRLDDGARLSTGSGRPERVEERAARVPHDAEAAVPRAAAPGEEFWEALMHPGQKLEPGAQVIFEGTRPLHAEVLERLFFGRRVIRLWAADGGSVADAVDAIGHVPLPPYIKRGDRPDDRDRYQTVFARTRGSVAAPTAGLHFTPALAAALRDRGVEIAEITLHVGYGTFQPLRVERVEEHRLEAERFEISPEAAAAIERARADRRRVIAVGTTTTRTLEAVARNHDGRVVPGSGATDLFISPGFEFRVLNGLLTNFHLPRSSLLMLVCAFAGRPSAHSGRPELAEGRGRVLAAYHEAIARGYRFYSYGDAMLII